MALLSSQQRPQILIDIYQPDDLGPFVIEVTDPLSTEDKLICSNQLPADYNAATYTHAAKLLEQSRGLGDAPTAGTEWKKTQRYQEMVRLGRKLYTDLFGSNDAFAKYVRRAKYLQGGFQILLRLFNTASELWTVPWEYAHDGEQFIVAERGWMISRALRDISLDEDRLPARTLPRPLCVLAVLPDPVDAIPLNVEQEIASIKSALGPAERRGLIVVDFVEDTTLRNLDLALAEREYHVLHYSGRGLSTGRGSCLVMEDESGKSAAAYTSELISILREHRSLRLVLLNACRGGMLGEAVAVTGITADLLTLVPAVVMMQFSGQGRTLIEFTRSFYGALVMGATLEEAVHAGRAAMQRQFERQMDWGTPALYLQRTHFRLINAESPPVPSTTQAFALDPLPRPRMFVGRRDEQRKLRGILPLLKISAAYIWGMPGIGKSALARRLVERPGRAGIIDDVHVIDCTGTSPRELLTSVATWLAGHFPEAEDVLLNPLLTAELKIFEAAKIVKRKRLILILDRFDALMTTNSDGIGMLPNKALHDFFVLLASASWSVLTIFTSRRYWNAIPQMRAGAVLSLHVSELPEADVQHLFVQLEHLRTVLPDGLQRLVRMIGGHLGTLQLIDSAIARDPSRAHRIDESFVRGLLSRLEADWLGEMLNGLDEKEIEGLTALSMMTTGFWSAQVRYLLRTATKPAAEAIMVRWEMRSLIHYLHDDHNEEPWYAVASIVASMLVQRQTDERRAVLHRRAAESIQEGLFEAAQDVKEATGHLEVIPDDMFGTACEYLRYMIGRSTLTVRERLVARALDWRTQWIEAGRPENARAIVDVIWQEMAETFGRVGEAHALLVQSVKAASGREGMLIRASIAQLNERQGREEQALEQYAALANAFAKMGDPQSQADMIANQARILADRDVRQAYALETEALKLRTQAGSERGIAASYRSMAGMLAAHNDPQGALNMIGLAVRHAQASEKPAVIAPTLLAQGTLLAETKAYQEAMQSLQHAAESAHDAGDLRVYASALGEMGEIHRLHHSYDLAVRSLVEAIEISEHLSDQQALALHLFRLAQVYHGMTNYADARIMAERAMDSARNYRPELVPDIQRLVRLIKRGR